MTPRKIEKLWWVYLDQKVHGPFTLEQIGQMPGIGERTRVCPESSQEWTTLGELASALESQPAPETGRRCANCSHKVRGGAKYCDRCGTLLGEGGSPGLPGATGKRASRTGRLGTLVTLALVAAAAALSWRVVEKRNRVAPPAGRVAFEAKQLVYAKSIRDVRSEDRSPLPGKRFLVVTLAARNPDPHPAPFDRSQLRWVSPDGKAAELDGLTPFIPSELLAVPVLEPGVGIEGRVVFQVPEGADKFRLLYAGSEIKVSPALLQDERRWRGQEDAAVRAAKAFRCKGADGKPRPWDPNVDMEARQELGPLYHVDAEDYALHVDLASGRVTPAPDGETLVVENTRRDCFASR